MFSELRRALFLVMSSLLVFAPALIAQQADANAPIPPQILNAQRAFVANGGASNYFETFVDGPNRAYSTFYKMMKRTGRYELVSSPGQADLIFEIRAVAPVIGDWKGVVSYNPQVVLSIRDPRTNVTLWSESANVRAFGTKKRRDRQFDQSVAVLVDKLAVVTGQPLTDAQTKAIAGNSKMPTAEKVVIVSGIAGAAAITAVGLHMVANPPKLSPPPMPATPTLPR